MTDCELPQWVITAVIITVIISGFIVFALLALLGTSSRGTTPPQMRGLGNSDES